MFDNMKKWMVEVTESLKDVLLKNKREQKNELRIIKKDGEWLVVAECFECIDEKVLATASTYRKALRFAAELTVPGQSIWGYGVCEVCAKELGLE